MMSCLGRSIFYLISYYHILGLINFKLHKSPAPFIKHFFMYIRERLSSCVVQHGH